jgi:hypothetical protein
MDCITRVLQVARDSWQTGTSFLNGCAVSVKVAEAFCAVLVQYLCEVSALSYGSSDN